MSEDLKKLSELRDAVHRGAPIPPDEPTVWAPVAFDSEKLARSIVAFAGIANAASQLFKLDIVLNITAEDAAIASSLLGGLIGTAYDLVGFAKAKRYWSRRS